MVLVCLLAIEMLLAGEAEHLKENASEFSN